MARKTSFWKNKLDLGFCKKTLKIATNFCKAQLNQVLDKFKKLTVTLTRV